MSRKNTGVPGSRLSWRLYFVVLVGLHVAPLLAQVNSWTSLAGGLWHNAATWSLGVPPAVNQDVMVTNGDYSVPVKTVTINGTTAATYPTTMTVNSLRVSGESLQTLNTLALVTGGSPTPLTVSNLFELGLGGTLALTNSVLRLNNYARIDGAIIEASGGLDAGSTIFDIGAVYPGRFDLLDGTAGFAQIRVGQATNGTVNQVGGMCSSTNMYIGYSAQGDYYHTGGTNSMVYGLSVGFAASAVGNYNLSGGTLDIGSGTFSLGVGGRGLLTQWPGTRVQTLYAYCGDGTGSTGTYVLSGGLATNAYFYNGNYGTGVVNQWNGTNSVLYYYGGGYNGGSGTYNLLGGALNISAAYLGNGSGTGTINQSGGEVQMGYLVVGGSHTGLGAYNATNGTLALATGSVGNSGPGVFNQVGATCWITNLMIGNGLSAPGQYDLVYGLLVSSSLTVNKGGTLTVETGSVDAPITTAAGGVLALKGGSLFQGIDNHGAFTYEAGNVGGRLVNYGSFAATGSELYLGDGLVNYSTFVLPAAFTLSAAGNGVDNEDLVVLNNSTLFSYGSVLNNGTMSGYGGITSYGGVTNNGQIVCSGGSLGLTAYGPGAYNNGLMTLANGLQLRLEGSLYNNSSLDLGGAIISGSGSVVNAAGAVVTGPGSFQAGSFFNQGLLYLEHGPLNLSSLNNSGTVMLDGDTANLLSAPVSNTGTMQGHGTLALDLSNSGTIEALGGTLLLPKSVYNYGAGLLTASTGNRLLISGPIGPNDGLINLRGGTLDIGNQRLNNQGQISGWGSFRIPLDNNGSVTFVGGSSTIYGLVTNSLGWTITVADDPALFTGPVYNYGQFKVSSTTVRFSGGYYEFGAFNSDPATNIFADLTIGATGYLLGGPRDNFTISGSLTVASVQSNLWNTAQADLVLKGGANHAVALPGRDDGAVLSGYSANFAWNSFRLGAGENLLLMDGNSTPGAGLYTRKLILEGGLAQVSSITGNGCNVYYDPAQPENNYLNSTTYDLAGGGKLIPVAAPIRIRSIAIAPDGSILLNCTGVPSTAHTIQASTNLTTWTSIGTATADLNGAFSFTDSDLTNSSAKFYRLSVP